MVRALAGDSTMTRGFDTAGFQLIQQMFTTGTGRRFTVLLVRNVQDLSRFATRTSRPLGLSVPDFSDGHDDGSSDQRSENRTADLA